MGLMNILIDTVNAINRMPEHIIQNKMNLLRSLEKIKVSSVLILEIAPNKGMPTNWLVSWTSRNDLSKNSDKKIAAPQRLPLKINQ